MQEIIVDPIAQPTTMSNLGQLARYNADEGSEGVAFSVRDGESWRDLTYGQFADKVEDIAKGLIAAGVQTGDRVALMSRTRFEWTLCDFAIWTAGAVPVPVYETSSAEQVSWILSDCEAVAIITELEPHTQRVASVRDDLPALKHVWQIDAGHLEELAEAGAEVDEATLRERANVATRDDIATIIYTSGTTGRPKGCELRHGNFLDLSENTKLAVGDVVAPGSSTILFLPLAHVLARLIEVLAFYSRARIGHSPDITNLMDDLQSFRPTFLLCVPRVFEKIYNATDQRLAAEGKGRLFRLAAKTAISYSRALDEGGASLLLRAQHKLFDIIVFSKLRAVMGGQVRYAVCGGAPLGPRLGHFFRGVGINVLEGYGLTETTAPTNVCVPGHIRIGTVGQPLPGVGIRIAEDGEILASGVGVFRGYYKNEEATRETFTEDGWLKTGDIGELDDDGNLTITGRKKELLVTAGGKNVAPTVLEDVVRAHPLVSQCLVVGDRRPYIAALVTIDSEMLPAWGKAHDRPNITLEEAYDDPYVHEHLQQAIDRANKSVSRAESIREFRVLRTDFTEAGGYLTPSMKLKRPAIYRDFGDEIEALYANSPSTVV
ncbi:long-chain acyl-CoA synthetase [Kineosphaera limosa]|uniref:Acyl-CoA synthetase n=1 Tax=Kineosphaera limosa NBRC 100340 TaxID=1184609 RepID=K6VL46_9MICO|nr:AMP-dependent synthetase/ligase [Kineosphaera limosa]NYD99032.1 long-chain acyl-CoA synthetase [Kineosphaera limosa]GAB96933.1 long-chain-fatty-acid--CoA ligase [Kineosphaera limosa NBRC 100340]